MAQVSITEEAHGLLSLYAQKHGLKKYEALSNIIKKAASGLHIAGGNDTSNKKPTVKVDE